MQSWVEFVHNKVTMFGTRRVLVGITLFASSTLASTQEGQSTFVIPDNSLGFGFTIPFKNESTTDMYFTIRADDSASWAAVGIGSHEMEGALIFVIYSSADGNSVTCSPRPSRADIEPAHDSSLNVETLESHIQDGKMYFSGKCTNCRNWKGGYLDVTSQTAKGIYAMGPKGSTLSDDKSAGIRYHTSYGSFNIDMNHATGTGNAPVIDDNTSAFGAELYEDDQESGKRDLKSTFHAFVMILTFIGLMPGGVAILRFGNSVRFHWINQSLAVLSVIIGLGLGIYDSLYYQRTRGFKTAHQIIGFIVVGFVLGQSILGFIHHRAYQHTQRTTKMAPIHVWLGRVIIVIGTVNGFLGFNLALTPWKNYILAGSVTFISVVFAFLIFGKAAVSRILGKRYGRRLNEDMPGYAPESWRHVPSHGGSSSPYEDSFANSGYRGAHRPQDVGLTVIGTSEYGSHHRDKSLEGTPQAPREYI